MYRLREGEQDSVDCSLMLIVHSNGSTEHEWIGGPHSFMINVFESVILIKSSFIETNKYFLIL